MIAATVRRKVSAVLLLLSVVHGGRHSHYGALESMERELSERVGVTASGKLSRQQLHHRPHHVERHDADELYEEGAMETQVMQLQESGIPEDANVAVPGSAGEAQPVEPPSGVDATPQTPASGDGTPGSADEAAPSDTDEAPAADAGEVSPEDPPDSAEVAPPFEWPVDSDDMLPAGSGESPEEEGDALAGGAPPGSVAEGPTTQIPNVPNTSLDEGDLSNGVELVASGASKGQEDSVAINSTATTNSSLEGEKSSESQSEGEEESGTAAVGDNGDASEGDASEGDHDSNDDSDAVAEPEHDEAEDTEPVEPQLPAGGVAEVAAHAVEEVTEAGEARPEHAEVNLGVIRQFPHMAVWEARLHHAIRDSGDSGKCSDISDTAFKGYGCAIQEHDKPACECRGGHEECLRHSSEDVLDYLWMIKDNKTVDETIMRELLAGRCDYMGGHEINRGSVAAMILALLLPVSAACVMCFCPVLVGVYVWGKKKRQAGGKRRAGHGSTHGGGPLLEAPGSSASEGPLPQQVAASEAGVGTKASEPAVAGTRRSGQAAP